MLKESKIEYVIGVDIGGTKMSAILLNGSRVIADYTLATPKDDLPKFTAMLGALLEPLFDRAKKDKVKIKGIGIGLPAVLDITENKVLVAPNAPVLNNLKIVDLVKEKIDAEAIVKIDNDANCFARAEALLGAGKKCKSVYGLIIGTGIGGGWWINDSMYTGAFGSANEPGDMVIDFKTGITLEGAYHKLMQNNPAALAGEAYQGDRLAEEVFVEFGQILGAALTNIINLIEPEIIIVGGGATQSADLYLPTAKKVLKNMVLSP
ncbi:ROK family protein, partial [Candidatus Falkowbacteria bacterium]|nr:ROK family protein [Candidatus Falkowbacteria bacterium]